MNYGSFLVSEFNPLGSPVLVYRRTEQISLHMAARRETIALAARAIVAEHGFQALSMQQVAGQAGVATGTLYRYFPSKDDLCAEIVTTISERELEHLRETMAAEAPPLDRLWRAVHSFSARALRARVLAYSLMAEPVEPQLDRLRIHYRAALADNIANLIEQGIADKSLPDQNAAASAAFMVGAFIEGVIGPHAPKLAAEEQSRLAETIASFCLRGAGARPRDLARIAKRYRAKETKASGQAVQASF